MRRPRLPRVRVRRDRQGRHRTTFGQACLGPAAGRFQRIDQGVKLLDKLGPLLAQFPASFHVRLFGMNAVGKVYSVDRTYTLTQ
jgi:uncharacterized protein YecE (DUF72 family)